nr:hypothetical protein [Tanacetum cinerariifolium]
MWWMWCVDWWRDEVVAGGLGAAVEVDSGGVVGRVGESGVGDLIDRKTRIIFGFVGNARRKSFPAAAVVAGGWWWLAGGGGLARCDGGGTFMKRRPGECYDLIKNIIAHHNDWDTSAQRSESSSSITSSFDTEIVALKAEMAKINKNLMRILLVNQQVKAVTPSCETCGGSHSYNDCPATVGQTQNVYAAGAYQGNSYQPQGNRNLLSYRSDNYLGPPGFNQNQNRANQNQNFQNQNRNHEIPQGNNQGRNQFFQGASHGQNPPPAYQAPGYQAPVHQPQIPQPLIPLHRQVRELFQESVAARGGEWCGGSSRSGWEECFWGSPEKFSGGSGGGRRLAGSGRSGGRCSWRVCVCFHIL